MHLMNIDKVFLQKQYIDFVSTRLEQFTVQSHTPYKANFRCEVCGDSSKNKFKKRGYILERSGGIFYFCHNCDYNKPFDSYLKDRHYDLFRTYYVELLSNKPRPKQTTQPEIKKQVVAVKPINYLDDLIDVLDLDEDHPCIDYLLYRQFPDFDRGKFFYTDTFYQYINNILPGKINPVAVSKYEHARLVFPLRTEEGKVFGVIGRSFDDEGTRYLTIKFEEYNKIYGLESLDRSQHCHVVEGPIDSLFLDNGIALAGTDGDISLVFNDKKAFTMVLDNQPRNKEVLSKYDKYISKGYNIVIWPDQVKQKDINAMVLAGLSKQRIHATIKQNTYSGLAAQIAFSNWKKFTDDSKKVYNQGFKL